MNSGKPPRLAAWILQEFGPERNQEALAGDLIEAFQQGRSRIWYWRQVLAAIRWRRHLYRLLILGAGSWWMTSPDMWRNAPLVSRPLDMTIFMVVLLPIRHLPRLLRGKLRAVLAGLIVVFFCLLHHYRYDMAFHYSILAMMLINGLVFQRKALAPTRHFTIRELVYGDPNAERQRLMEKLHLTMLQETDPQMRQAYAESIAALQRHQSTDAKAT